VAVALRKEPGVEVEMIDGDPGELTVSVNGKVVAQKGDRMLSLNEVLKAVKEA
jgi:hypothetical protein